MYRKDVKCFKVDGEIIKADMFYMLEDGEAVLVDSGDENEWGINIFLGRYERWDDCLCALVSVPG